MTAFWLADSLTLPLETVTEKLAWLGRTGSGKTYGAMKLAELMLEAGAQIGAIDPVGVWRALRVPAKKDGQSFEVVVFGGLYGDLPLEPTSAAGELVADLVTDRGLSFVLDISQCIPREQQTFLQGFTHRFFHRKKSKPSAVHLFLEECQEYIPENPSGVEAITLGHMQRLWKLGRNFGIGGSLISQRPQEIAKKALNMSGTLFAFQMTGPQERKAIRSWVSDQGIAVDIEAVLQKLQVGEPHVESPTFLEVSKTVRILPRVTADLSSTPKVGESTAAKRPLTPIDVEQLKTSMAATIEKAKADDPRELRKQLLEKDRQIKQLEKSASGSSTSDEGRKHEVKPLLTDADRALIEKLRTRLDEIGIVLMDGTKVIAERFAGWVRDETQAALAAMEQKHDRARADYAALVESKGFQKILDKLAKVQPTQITPNAAAVVAPRSPHVRRVDPVLSTSRPAHVVSDVGGELGKGERQVLIAIAQHQDGVTREQLTQLTGYKRSTRDTYLQRLSQRGAIQIDNVGIMASEEGLALLGDDYEPLPTGDDLRAYWLQRLSGGARDLLAQICHAYPQPITRERLSELTNYARSSRDTYLQRLAALRLIVTDGGGRVHAVDELFSSARSGR